MSIPERKAACLGAYHPHVFEIQEQRMLFTTEAMHPLTGLHPDRVTEFPHFRGTVEVADRLGYLNLHSTLRCKISGDMKTVPWPYQGDLLLFLDLGTGPYCINWPVKASRGDFLGQNKAVTAKEQRQRHKKRARHEIELAYYWDAGIRSEAIAGDDIEDTLSNNLLRLCCYAVREIDLPQTQIEDTELALQSAMKTGMPAAAVLARLCATARINSEQGRTIFYQAIWYRRLRVDLFRPVLIDQQMVPETTDLLDYFDEWFRR
jgi:hypothetical protein